LDLSGLENYHTTFAPIRKTNGGETITVAVSRHETSDILKFGFGFERFGKLSHHFRPYKKTNGGETITGAVSRHETRDILLWRNNFGHDDIILLIDPSILRPCLNQIFFWILTL